MDPSVQRLLTDKLYDKRKQGALELEKLVREATANKEYERIRKIVEQLCHDYAYAVHQPHARNGGLIGLAAASIALGSDEVARYLEEIVPPVLACFTDQDARVRYYACEAMYNIAKVAKGEILLFFNDIFDALCKLAADSELSVKNGAELLDRLVKDIVSESAASYVSILNFAEKEKGDDDGRISIGSDVDLPTAFSLAKFIPLLEERIHVINPFTRTFLVSWLTLLDTIPDLELVHYLPAFLAGLFKFLGDPNRDVYVATQGLLERFLSEIVKIAKIKRGIAESRRSRRSVRRRASDSQVETSSQEGEGSVVNDQAVDESVSESLTESYDEQDGDWIPGQDVQVDHTAILDILLKFVDVSSNKDSAPTMRVEGLSKQKEEEIGIVALRWIGTFFEVSPEDILPFVPRLLEQVLPALSAQSEQVRTTANNVNRSLMDYIVRYHEEYDPEDMANQASNQSIARRQSTASKTVSQQDLTGEQSKTTHEETPRSSAVQTPQPHTDLDYAAAVNALTLQFLNEHEETRVAALLWLIMLHKKAPKRVLAFNDGTFPALLKTLSDPAEVVVTRDLQLLSQISKNSEDSYFTSFMVALLQLFSTDRKLLEIRGNLIIRQLCINLMPERIYRTLADCIEKDEDIEFASIMVQNLNNNLITAPELLELRKRLRNLDSKDGQMFFNALFRAWCHNAVATFSLCLLAQAYEQAYNLLQIFADLEMTVNMLIQIDKLVQLLESPVFTYLRLQLLEPDRYPYLYKCLYGLLMLLPQSSAFAALKNRLNSVSAIGLLHTPASMPTSARPSPGTLHHSRQRSAEKGLQLPLSVNLTMTSVGSLTAPNTSVAAGMAGSNLPTVSGVGAGSGGRLARREIGGTTGSEVKWSELMEKFRQTQEKSRRRSERLLRGEEDEIDARSGRAMDGRGEAGTSGGLGNPISMGTGDRNNRANGLDNFDNSQGNRPGSALSGGMAGMSLSSGPGGIGTAFSRRSANLGTGYSAGTGLGVTGSRAMGPGGMAGGPGIQSNQGQMSSATVERPPNKSRHSLAGFGKFASGIAKGGSRSKDSTGSGKKA